MRIMSVLGFYLCMGCGNSEAAPPESEAPVQAAPAPTREGASPVPESWVTPRRDAAKSRLGETAAGQLIWQAIEAHGGLEAWLSAGTIEFEFDYAPIGNPDARKHTFQRVDLWSARAHHQEIDGDAEFGFDGEASWMKPNAEAFSPSSRFWSLTPYYFVGMPFVLADPGVILTQLEDAELNGTTYKLVKASYESGTGDSPDDYYIVYLHPETHRVAALRYVVSFPGMFAPGEHSPEKIMMYTEGVEVGGLRFASEYHTYRWNAEEGLPGERVTDIVASRVVLGESYQDSIFVAPEGAVIETAP
ncbi:MAG: hypothetical protein ACI9KE_004285 [Polyangiales bacterium]|jgi:hypothetical protein